MQKEQATNDDYNSIKAAPRSVMRAGKFGIIYFGCENSGKEAPGIRYVTQTV